MTDTKPSQAAMRAAEAIASTFDEDANYFDLDDLKTVAAIIEKETGLTELRDALDGIVNWINSDLPDCDKWSEALRRARAALARVND